MKAKRFLLAILVLIPLLVVGLIFFGKNIKSLPLLSPIGKVLPKPDLSAKLSQKITLLPTLDYSHDGVVNSISDKLSYLVFNPDTGRVYSSKDITKRIYPASFTKLMTTQVALDVLDPSTLVKATATSVNKEPTVLGLKVGEQLPITELIRACIATSANDAAATLGEGVAAFYGQSIDYFADLMNQKAQMLHMTNTRFANPEGYDDQNQYSDLEDLARLVYNVYKNYPTIMADGKSDRQDIVADSNHGKYYLPNWNGLLGVYPGVSGLKIAYTENAGYSTIVTANRGGKNVVVILSGANSIPERDLAAAALLDDAYIKEKMKPVNVTRSQLQRHYNVWNALAKQIRAELKALEASNSASSLLNSEGNDY